MRVKELIQKLSTFPSDCLVVYNSSGEAREISYVDSIQVLGNIVINDDEKIVKGATPAIGLTD